MPYQGGAAGGRREPVTQAVTVLVGTVVVLSFLFAFGNVWALGVRLGVPAYVAPLVAPAVDLSVVALLLGTRELALRGASAAQLRPARRLLVFCGLATLSLNVAEPLIAAHYGRAAFDSVGSCLLLGWAHVGPALLQAMHGAGGPAPPPPSGAPPAGAGGLRPAATAGDAEGTGAAGPAPVPRQRRGGGPGAAGGPGGEDDLLSRARAEDARHWEQYRRPISAEALRKHLGVGAARSRSLVAQLRDEHTGSGSRRVSSAQGTSSAAAAGAS